MPTRSNLSSAQIDQHLQQQLSSGLSVSEYCQLHQLKVASFHNWRSTRRKRASSVVAPQWVELTGLAQTGQSLKGLKPESGKVSEQAVINRYFEAGIDGGNHGVSQIANHGVDQETPQSVIVELTLPGGLVLSIRPA